MKNGRKLGLLVAVVMVGVMAVPAFAASQRGVVTVGDFVKNVAGAMRLPAMDATTAEAAIRAAGFTLPRLDRNAALTEGAVAAIASSVGLRVASSNPAAGFNQAQVDQFLASMGSGLGSSRFTVVDSRGSVSTMSTESSASGSGSGKGKKKPHSKSPKKPHKPKKPKKPKKDGHVPPGIDGRIGVPWTPPWGNP